MTEEELNALIAQAEGGDVATMNQVAHVYSDNADFKDSEKAFIWYKNSAELGNVNSMSNLGAWCYLWGNGTEKSLKLAIEWLEKAAEKDDIWSICRLACDIYSQDNEFKDIDKALAWFEKIVERSVAVVQVDYDRALACVEKIAEEGNPKAICLMPRMLPDPFGGEHPDKWKWIQKAAEVGDAQCQYKMAEKMLSNNEDEDAYKWFALSAKEGNADAKTRLNSLGLDFQNGNNGRKQNQSLAYRFYVAAAECGDFNGMANAGYCISNGIGVEKDLNKAYEYFKQAADLGHWIGMSNLGWCYLYGNGVEKDVEKAIHWLTRAAEEGNNIWSMNRLTEIYGERDGYIDYEKAMKWFNVLIQKDSDPQSGVYHNTQYDKDLYEKTKSASELVVLIEKDDADSTCSPFENMSGEFVIPKGCKHIGERAFFACHNIKSITIPNSVTSIGKDAFSGCGDLISVIIPEGVKNIGESAFESSGLTSVTIPNSVTSIGDRAFDDCSSLASIDVAMDNPHFCSINGVLFDKSKTRLVQYPRGKSGTCYSIPNSVTNIGIKAFYLCSDLTSVTIPYGVVDIGWSAFAGCRSLKSIDIPDSVISIGRGAFRGCKRLVSVKISNRLKTLEKNTFNDCERLSSIVIPDSVISIEDSAFRGCYELSSVVLGNSIESIGELAFSYLSPELRSIKMPRSIKSIGKEAFKCTYLDRVTLPSGVKLGEDAFDEDTSVYRD